MTPESQSPEKSENGQSQKTINLRRCMTHAYSRAAFWDSTSAALALAAFLLGLARAYLQLPDPWASLTLILLGIGTFFARLRQSHHRGRSERLKRHHEYVAGLGLPISDLTIADYRAGVSNKELAKFDKTLHGSEFATSLPVGPVRLLEQMEESAWFSEKLATCAAWIALCVVVLASIVAFSVLYVSGLTPGSSTRWIQTAGSVVLFLITGGILTRCLKYFSFANAARDCVRALQPLLRDPALRESAAMAVVLEYQVQRAGSPLVPSIFWRLKHRHLNELWAERQSEKDETAQR